MNGARKSAGERPRRSAAATWAMGTLLALIPAGCGPASPPEEITVYAAVSLSEAMTALQADCEQKSGARLVFNLAGSGTLARQILAAGSADLFLSADEAWVTTLQDEGRIDAGEARVFLSNRLVVVTPGGDAATTRALPDLAREEIARIAIADPEGVPAGRYARAWLERSGWWDRLSPKLVPTLDVRAALASVASGAADAGIVYRSEVAAGAPVSVAFTVEGPAAPAIRYVAARIAGRPNAARNRSALDCLTGPDSWARYRSLGFVPVGADGSEIP